MATGCIPEPTPLREGSTIRFSDKYWDIWKHAAAKFMLLTTFNKAMFYSYHYMKNTAPCGQPSLMESTVQKAISNYTNKHKMETVVNLMQEMLLWNVITGNPIALKHWRRCSQRTCHSPLIQGQLGGKLCRATRQQSHDRKTNFHALLQHTLCVLICQWGKTCSFIVMFLILIFFLLPQALHYENPLNLHLPSLDKLLTSLKYPHFPTVRPRKQWHESVLYPRVFGSYAPNSPGPPVWVRAHHGFQLSCFLCPSCCSILARHRSRPCNPAWSAKATPLLDPAWWACFKNFLNIVWKRMRNGETIFNEDACPHHLLSWSKPRCLHSSLIRYISPFYHGELKSWDI